MNFFLLLNTKDDILKNVSNQTVDGPLTFIGKSMGPQSTVWLPYQHYSKYLLLHNYDFFFHKSDFFLELQDYISIMRGKKYSFFYSMVETSFHSGKLCIMNQSQIYFETNA